MGDTNQQQLAHCHRAGVLFTFACVATIGLGAGGALAQRQSLTIEDVSVSLVDPEGAHATIDLGDISVTLSNRGGAGMSAVFRVHEPHQPGAAGGDLWDHLELHWVNVITADDCPATVRGVPAGRTALPFPVVDMPRHGWDYVYKSRRSSRARGPDRTEANADGREMRDDARDIWPWYHTPEEEAMEPDSGNGGGGFGQFRRGRIYGIRDLPSLCDAGGTTAFTTLLVGVVPEGRDGAGEHTLQQGQLLVLGGFDWDWTSAGLGLRETEFSIASLEQALHNSHFPEWVGVTAVPVAVETIAHTGGPPADRVRPSEPDSEKPPAVPTRPRHHKALHNARVSLERR